MGSTVVDGSDIRWVDWAGFRLAWIVDSTHRTVNLNDFDTCPQHTVLSTAVHLLHLL